jgi:hypothetical protein
LSADTNAKGKIQMKPEGSHGVIAGGCHCGAVRFSVHLLDGFSTIRRCSCSYCRMRGAIAVSARLGDLMIHSGQDNLSEYQFGSRTATHWFCRTCGIYTHHIRRSDPTLLGVNLACLEGVSPFDFTEVQVMDGENHPADKGGPSRLFGTLRFDRTP